VTLWVVGEGRYEASNFDNVRVDADDIVWNWDTNSSNLSDLRTEALAQKDGFAWLTEVAQPYSKYDLAGKLDGSFSMSSPESLGYLGDPATGITPMQEVQNDLEHLFGTMSDVWVTRLHAQLPRLALATDLTVGASEDQSPVSAFFQATKAVGQPPICPDYSWCNSDGGGTTSSSSGTTSFEDPESRGTGVLSDESDSACSTSAPLGTSSGAAGWLLGLGMVGLGAASRRRRG
jgi:hypothetical protein